MAEQNNQTPGSATEELNNLISELKQELHMDEPAPLPDRTPAPEPEPLPEPEDEFDIVFDDAYEKPEADPEPAEPQYAVPVHGEFRHLQAAAETYLLSHGMEEETLKLLETKLR